MLKWQKETIAQSFTLVLNMMRRSRKSPKCLLNFLSHPIQHASRALLKLSVLNQSMQIWIISLHLDFHCFNLHWTFSSICTIINWTKHIHLAIWQLCIMYLVMYYVISRYCDWPGSEILCIFGIFHLNNVSIFCFRMNLTLLGLPFDNVKKWVTGAPFSKTIQPPNYPQKGRVWTLFFS